MPEKVCVYLMGACFEGGLTSFCRTEGAELLLKDLKLKFGTESVEADSHTLGVLGEKTWPVVGSLALAAVERLIAETEWAHQVLKVTSTTDV